MWTQQNPNYLYIIIILLVSVSTMFLACSLWFVSGLYNVGFMISISFATGLSFEFFFHKTVFCGWLVFFVDAFLAYLENWNSGIG